MKDFTYRIQESIIDADDTTSIERVDTKTGDTEWIADFVDYNYAKLFVSLMEFLDMQEN